MRWTKFDPHYVSGTEAGASSNPCSESYAGETPFSEIETKSLAEYFRSISKKPVAYLDFHSYSQLLMFPYGHSAEHVPNYDELVRYVFFIIVILLVIVFVIIIIIAISMYMHPNYKISHYRKLWYTWDNVAKVRNTKTQPQINIDMLYV